MTVTVYANQNDNLDAVVYRYFGTKSGNPKELLKQVMELNPKLANTPILAIGTAVILPSLENIHVNTEKTVIQLWD